MLYQCVTDYAVLTEQVHMMKRHVQHWLTQQKLIEHFRKSDFF